MEKITLSVGNQQISCTLFFPENQKEKNPAVLFIPGWTSREENYRERAEKIAILGYVCLAISLRGHGESDGTLKEFSRADHLEDVLRAYDFLAAQKNVDKNNISVVGASYGGYLAALLCNKRGVATVVLRAPALYINSEFSKPTAELISEREDEFFKNFIPEQNNKALLGVKKVPNRTLIIESEKDQIIPHNIIEYYLQAADKKSVTHTIIKNADHQLTDTKWRKEFIDILITWFKKNYPNH